MIAPTHDGGVYYTPPSDDFSRPGRMWWSVPDDANTFTTWRELTTVYHEALQAITCRLHRPSRPARNSIPGAATTGRRVMGKAGPSMPSG
ncbi:hypothetical protein JCM18920_2163 [Cutibacterium acnes JCM 18920]|nr:hypothetical protein JCM18920_2163 [Cutibacterium acnes JCM 18920]